MWLSSVGLVLCVSAFTTPSIYIHTLHFFNEYHDFNKLTTHTKINKIINLIYERLYFIFINIVKFKFF